MNVKFALQDTTGHTEVSISDGTAIVEWERTGDAERKKLHSIVSEARSKGYDVFSANDKGEAKGDKLEKLEDDHFNRKGSLVLKAPASDGLASISFLKGVINLECKSGRICMEQDDDGEWKYTNAVSFKPKDREQKLQSRTGTAGG